MCFVFKKIKKGFSEAAITLNSYNWFVLQKNNTAPNPKA